LAPPPGYASYAGTNGSGGGGGGTKNSKSRGSGGENRTKSPHQKHRRHQKQQKQQQQEHQQTERPSRYSHSYGSHGEADGGGGATGAGPNNPLSSPAASGRAPRASGWGNGGGGSGSGGLALTTPVVVRKPEADGSGGGGGGAFAAPPQTAPRGGTTSKPPLYTPAGVALARNPHLHLNVTPNSAAAATSASDFAATASSGGDASTSAAVTTTTTTTTTDGGDGDGSTGRASFSPATVQLARTLDNLMDDDDADDDGNDKVVGVTAQQGQGQGRRPPDGPNAGSSPQHAVGTGRAVGGGGAAGGGGSALDALAAAIHASPRRAAMLGDNSTITATADLSLSSSSADPSPTRAVRGGIGAAAGTGMEDWSSVYPYENDLAGRLDAGARPPGLQQQQQQQQNHSPLGRAQQSTDAGAPHSFGAFSPPAKNHQPDQHAPQRNEAASSGGGDVGPGQQQQQQRRTRSSDSPDAEMTQLQQQFNQLGQPNAVPPQQFPGPYRGWMGGQSPNIFSQSPVPPGAGIFGAAGMSFMQDPRQMAMSPMNVPPLPSGIMVRVLLLSKGSIFRF